ncbi:unnamed protein product [Paramecium sonneborni]|uniref:Uncharacterized protein n=1 Tax=Paramecium sonneborni TaxID=65129 RepID=A0A8S1PNE7_9CILI|nr:unnamed protein product [Paramecium sonneborni]
MKKLEKFQIVKNMKIYILDDIHKLQKKTDDDFVTSPFSINTDRELLPDLKSIILNQSYLDRINYDGQPYDETYSKSIKTDSSNKLFIFEEEQFVNGDSISSEQISNEF